MIFAHLKHFDYIKDYIVDYMNTTQMIIMNYKTCYTLCYMNIDKIITKYIFVYKRD